MFGAEPRLVDVSLGWAEQRVGPSGCWQCPSSCPQAVFPTEPPPFPWVNAEGTWLPEAVTVNCEEVTGAAEELSPSAALC